MRLWPWLSIPGPPVFSFLCVVVHFFWLANVCLCCVFSIPSQQIGLGKRLRNDPFCVELAVKPQLNQSQRRGHRVMTHTHAKLQVRAKSVQKMDWKQTDTIDRITTAFPALLLAMTCHFRLLNFMSSIFTWSETRLFGHAFYSLRSQNSIKVSLC